MKYQDYEEKNRGAAGTEIKEERVFPPNEQGREEKGADQFQRLVCMEGTELLNKLGSGSPKASGDERYQAASEAIRELKNFHYNIGFVGEQSSGKSYVVNSLIAYPLMPCCILTTTATVVRLIYGQKIRITATDDDTGKQVLDIDCTSISSEKFRILKEYACAVMAYRIIENLQPFVDGNIKRYDGEKKIFRMDDLQMTKDDPRMAAVLLLILLSVYVRQDKKSPQEKVRNIQNKRKEALKIFGMPQETVNYLVTVQWDHPLLRSGLIITDLPGLGAAGQGEEKEGDQKRKIKSHDKITKDAIVSADTDALVFLMEPTLHGTGLGSIKEMLSSAKLKESMDKESHIIAVMNKADLLKGEGEVKTAVNEYIEILREAGVRKEPEDIWLYSSKYGDYGYENIKIERTCYYWDEITQLEDDGADPEEIEEEKERLPKKLKRRYEKANIDRFREFFRTDYMERCKYEKAFAALLALTRLAAGSASPLKTEVANYEALKNMSAGLRGTGVLGTLRMDTGKVVKRAIEDLSLQIQRNEEDAWQLKNMLEPLPDMYIRTFNEALGKYRKDNLAITQDFVLAYGGMAFSASLDKPENISVYDRLKESIGKMDVDITETNKFYADVLKVLDAKIRNIYEDVEQSLNRMEEDFPGEIDAVIRKLENEFGQEYDPEILKPLHELCQNIVDYAGEQVLASKADMLATRDRITKQGAEIAGQMIKLNDKYTANFRQPIIDDIQRCCEHAGAFFNKRKYVWVDEPTKGIRVKLQGIQLSEDDKRVMRQDIRKTGNEQIINQMNGLYQAAESDSMNVFAEFMENLEALFQTAEENAAAMGDAVQGHYDEKKAELDKMAAVFSGFQSKVQKSVDEVLASGDVDRSYQILQGNIFGTIFEI